MYIIRNTRTRVQIYTAEQIHVSMHKHNTYLHKRTHTWIYKQVHPHALICSHNSNIIPVFSWSAWYHAVSFKAFLDTIHYTMSYVTGNGDYSLFILAQKHILTLNLYQISAYVIMRGVEELQPVCREKRYLAR